MKNAQINNIDDILNAVSVIKEAIQRSQARAIQAVGSETLSLYYGIGRYVSEHSRQGSWGTGAIKFISEQLQKEMPGLTGFGETNIKDMRTFYEEWSPSVNRQPMADDLQVNENQLLMQIRRPVADELDWNDFLRVPFTHHVIILRKVKDYTERIFYIHLCATRAWNKHILRDYIEADLYKDRGKLPNNFTESIPDKQLAIRTVKAFKENYLLGFINAEDIYENEDDRNEPLLNRKITENIREFILRFGQDFTFIQSNYRLTIGQEEKFVDLLFFNRQLNALVAVELKDCRFKPSHLGQLSFYLSVLDKQVRKAHENPSIGIVLCREMDRTVVELAIQDYTKPMGVATFTLGKDAPEEYTRLLPPAEKLSAILSEEG